MNVFRIIVMFCLVTVIAACGKTELGEKDTLSDDHASLSTKTPTIDVLLLQPQRLVKAQELPGRIQPIRTAQVRARVSGIVKRRLFEEGSKVRAGQPLYKIETASYEVALERAEAAIQSARVMVIDAEATVVRYSSLVTIGAVSKQDMLRAQTALGSAKAGLALAKAEAKQSKLDLNYATVRAPIDGYIGRSLITEGQLVGKDEATVLATIQQIDTVYADVTQSISDVMKLRGERALNKSSNNAEHSTHRITARIEGTSTTREGHLLFSEVSVDPGSGKVTLRGQFPNQDGMLLPGMYVRISMDNDILHEGLAIPQRAIRFGAQGVATARIVNAESKVEERSIETGEMYGNLWHITKGLFPGDRVIIDGFNVEIGQTVKVGKSTVTSEVKGI
ncbi:efflux RND transporter periplasmic adaptor subunit [Acinetobacter sp. GN11]